MATSSAATRPSTRRVHAAVAAGTPLESTTTASVAAAIAAGVASSYRWSRMGASRKPPPAPTIVA